jgi:hypothetical protein
MHTAAQLIPFPGWQLTHWMTSGLIARSIEYTLLMPLLIIGINVLVWGGGIWAAGSVVESRRVARDQESENRDDTRCVFVISHFCGARHEGTLVVGYVRISSGRHAEQYRRISASVIASAWAAGM